ncbi:MAG: ATP-binding cassette domain-containing protein, partial [Solirubrobacterales bacterium]
HGLSRDEGRSRAEALLTRVGLDRAADRRVGTYSGGMKRRLDLASALVHQPRVLFLDEPTTGLDPVSRKAIWEEVEALNDDGATIFLTTQYLEEADKLADRVGIIADGLLVAEDTPTALKAEIGNAHLEIAICDGEMERAQDVVAHLGRPLPSRDGLLMIELEGGASGVAPVVRALDDAGLAVESLDLVEPTLDDVFVAKTGRRLESDNDATEEADAEPARAGAA